MRTLSFRRIAREKNGQTAVEYLLTTVALTMVFAGMFGFLQGQLRRLFTIAGVKILSTYPK
jgi:Flp pilus assembly pilin Flp